MKFTTNYSYIGGGILVNENSIIINILTDYPNAEYVLRKYGIKPFGWGSYSHTSIGYAADMLNIDINRLLREINAAIRRGIWFSYSPYLWQTTA